MIVDGMRLSLRSRLIHTVIVRLLLILPIYILSRIHQLINLSIYIYNQSINININRTERIERMRIDDY